MIKTFSALVALTLFSSAAFSQANVSDFPGKIQTSMNSLGQTVEVTTASEFFITPPLSEWPEVNDVDADRPEEPHEADKQRTPPAVVNPDGLPHGMDPALQVAEAWRSYRAPIVNFNGQSGSGYPPDPTGAAGPNNYVQAVNLSYRVYSKTGAAQSTQHNLSSLWPGSSDEGDPIVMYDRHADRWFISQFNSGPNRLLVAVSQTGDPLGSYFTWSFTLSQFPDYPKYSVWWDGYYASSNSNKTAIALERSVMLNGGASAHMVALSAPSVITQGFHCLLPADADGDLPPNGTPCYFFNMEDDSWGAPTDRIKVYNMHVDWATTSNSTVTLAHTLTTTPFDNNFPASWDDIAQPGTTQKLDAIAGCLNYRAPHVRFVDHSSVVITHVVDVNGSDHAGIRWYELRDANDGNWAIYQQGTYSPDNAHRWIPSIAMDNQGNIGMAYCYSNPAATGYPGLRYTGRLASDPLGQMTFAETNAISGSASQTGLNRYGDYSQLSLDPNGGTFWHTGEYLGSGGQPRTRIFSFNLSDNVGVGEMNVTNASGLLRVNNENGSLNVSIDGLRTDDALQFDIIGSDGKQVRNLSAHPADKKWSTRMDIRDLAPGVWFARVGNAAFQKVQRFIITK